MSKFTLRRRSGAIALALALGLGVSACSEDSSKSSPTTEAAPAGAETTAPDSAAPDSTAPETTAAPSGEVLRVLVTNDDGVGADGLDALVEALRKLPDTEITVIAPLTNQSGTGSNTTQGALTVTDATTKSGFAAKAVAGFPADTVIYALDQGGLTERPHVVLSGVNQGANVGPLVNISGTVGAAKAAAVRGVPALASSQGIATSPDYASGARLALEWLAEHRDALLAGTVAPTVESLNIPTCPTGKIRGTVEVPTAADAGGRELLTSNCQSTSPAPTDDIDGFSNGYATLSPVPT